MYHYMIQKKKKKIDFEYNNDFMWIFVGLFDFGDVNNLKHETCLSFFLCVLIYWLYTS